MQGHSELEALKNKIRKKFYLNSIKFSQFSFRKFYNDKLWRERNRERLKSIRTHCNDVLCEDAPKTLTTEKQCLDFSYECTTQKAGGCVKKSTCKAIDIETACTTDVNGTICFWVNNQCRDKTCEYYPATSNFTCLSVNCLYGSNGTCTKSTTCSNIKDSTLCQKGTDGYCMWIADTENSDGSIGGCFLYSSCESMPYKTHDECNGFSDKCNQW